jgi:HK97 family phage major capsid protein
MSLEALRKSLKAESDSLDTLRTAASAPEATDADFTALKAQTDKVKGISDRIDAIEAAEKAGAKAAAPVETSPAEVRRVYAEAANPIDKSAGFAIGALMAGAAAVKSGQATSIRAALEENGLGQIADRFEGLSRSKQLSSTINTGGILVPPSMATEMIEFLRPSTAFLSNSPRRVPLVNGSYYQAAGNTGASAAYGAENGVPGYSEATFRDVTLRSKELMGKTAISNALISRGITAIRSFVETDLREAMSETMDRAMFLGTGLQQNPLGVYNVPGIGTRTAANATAPTIAQVEADLNWALNYLGTRNVNIATARWTMRLETATYLRSMRDGNGNRYYPEMLGNSPTLNGIPVAITTNLPNNLGGSSDGSHMSLIAYTHVLFGEEDGITIKASDVASYTDGGSAMRSAFERDETVMMTIAKHDVGLRHLAAVALLDTVRWGR